jgi:hypothetical protein
MSKSGKTYYVKDVATGVTGPTSQQPRYPTGRNGKPAGHVGKLPDGTLVTRPDPAAKRKR